MPLMYYFIEEEMKIENILIIKIIYKAVLLGKMELTDEKDLFNKIVNS